MRRIDLHMHTTHSDGSYAPATLMRFCKDKGLACVSVTDHDTMSGVEEAEREAKQLGIEMIPGVEISAQFNPGTLHILGYFIDPNHPKLKTVFGEIQKARRERNPLIIKKLNDLGIDITMEEVVEEACQSGEEVSEKQIGRPHFAKTLIKKGIVRNHEEAFSRYLTKGQPAYVDKRRVSKEEALQLIHEAGGIAAVAHPKQMRLEAGALEKEIEYLAALGLDAMEVYSSCQNRKESKIYRKIAKRFDLVETGGSDFHGTNNPGVDLGYLGEGVELDYKVIEALKNKVQRIN